MIVEELRRDEDLLAAQLWTRVGLTRAWNDPTADFHRALDGPTSTVLGARRDGALIGTVMVGHDGHRGWVYYLAVDAQYQGEGIGSALMAAAETWLRSRGALKIQLMVRTGNDEALGFYDKIGYEESDVRVLSRRLDGR
jgi:ribosomal protein S18 acetylase RimI-like enzyme